MRPALELATREAKPIDFDQDPFITQGLSPDGDPVWYYNFDVQPVEAAPILLMNADRTHPGTRR